MQPEMAKIQKRYEGRKDPHSQQQMQQEIMKLYKKYKINPLGCFGTMILQFPIFMSMYEVVQRTNATKVTAINGAVGVVNAGTTGVSTLNLGENAGATNVGLTTESAGMGTGASGLAFTSSQIGTTQVQGMSQSGMAMGLGGEGDNAIDVNYSTANNNASLGAFGATTSNQYGTAGTTTTTTTTKTVKYTTTTGQPIVGASNVLNPIVNTTVKEPIVTGSTVNFQTNNSIL
jgi:hypothetical protein